MLLATAGLLVIGLLKTPLRWSGAAFVLMAEIAWKAPEPDVVKAQTYFERALRSLANSKPNPGNSAPP